MSKGNRGELGVVRVHDRKGLWISIFNGLGSVLVCI